MKISVKKGFPFTKSIFLMKGQVLGMAIMVAFMLLGCHLNNNNGTVVPQPLKNLVVVANSPKQWTGVAVSKTGRIFVNYPNWSASHTISVAEITDTTRVKVFPDQSWNTVDSAQPSQHFICVQSVFIDRNDFLWVLDPANIQRNEEYLGVVPGGAKLVKIDLSSNKVVKTIVFNEPVITKNSYLNDVRIDEGKNTAYITDSNEGAIVVVDLSTGTAKRLLSNDPSTKSENIPLVVEGITWRKPNGELHAVHSDGIALSPDRQYLYWRATTGTSLYRIETALLNDSLASDSSLKNKPELMATLPPSDGIIFGTDGMLYLTSLEQNAIIQFDVNTRTSSIVAQSTHLKWPDSFSNGPDGLYVTTSEIHLKDHPVEPYRLFKLQ